MSIIQTIRDKYARWAVIGIALAIIGFLLMDASVGRSRMFSGGGSNTVGIINGKKIKAEDFSVKLDAAEKSIEQQQPGISSDAKRGQALEGLWNQEVSKIILDEELSKLGIAITENERADMISGSNPSQIAQQYLGQQGQPYNPAQALQLVNQVRRSKDEAQKKQLSELLDYMDRTRLEEKYTSLLSNSINVPKWVIESQNADNSRMAKLSFVKVNYTDPLFGADSSIKITDEEILAEVKKNKKLYKQTESRSISYVTFSAAPSTEDSAEVRNTITELSKGFLEAKDAKLFLDREGSDFPYEGNFTLAKSMQQAVKDSILKTPVGSIYGPYLDQTHYVTAKMIDSRLVVDSVNVRHILIATAQQDPQTGRFIPIMDTAIARIKIDSIATAIKGGAIFDSLCAKYSSDGNRNEGGIYKGVPWAKMVPPFNDFIFTNPVGYKGVVYTDFGFHYIEILQSFGAAANRAVKVAYLAKPIVTSNTTETDASNRANTFAGKSTDFKSFEANYEKELKPLNILKGIAVNIPPTGVDVGTLGQSRTLVKKIYEAKKGAVIQPEKVGENYVVAVVTEILEEGTQTATAARPRLESTLRNKKKVEILKTKLGAITTPEAAAAKLNMTVETADSVSQSNSAKISYDQKVLGACFNAANKGKTVPELIAGTSGIYILQVQSTGTVPVADANVAEKRKQLIQQAKMTLQYRSPILSLREAATVKDKRSDIY
jgi:peptidyl-prolyl cis-trans isomerase D